MSVSMAVATGLLLGAAGGALHLAVTRWRTGLAVRRGAAVALFAMPLGLIGPAAAVILATQVSAPAAWAAPFGLFGLRVAILGRARR